MKKPILIASLIVSSITGFAQELIAKTPIQLIDQLIFIQVTLNNSDPLNFIFDTGAGITVVDVETATKLQLPITSELTIGTSGKHLKTNVSDNNELLIGNVFMIDSLSIALMDLRHLSQYFKTKIDGIIGIDLLNQAIVETNIDSMEVSLFSNDNYRYSGKAKPLELIGLESNHLGLPIEIVPKGKKTPILLIIKIDTAAANYLTFHNHTVTEHNLVDSGKKYKNKQGFGADSTITNNLGGKINKAIFGEKVWKNIPVVFEVDRLNESSDRQANGLIGQKMLLDFNITYNLRDGVVYLEKRK